MTPVVPLEERLRALEIVVDRHDRRGGSRRVRVWDRLVSLGLRDAWLLRVCRMYHDHKPPDGKPGRPRNAAAAVFKRELRKALRRQAEIDRSVRRAGKLPAIGRTGVTADEIDHLLHAVYQVVFETHVAFESYEHERARNEARLRRPPGPPF